MFKEARVLLVPVIIIALIAFRRSRRQKSRAKHNLARRERVVYIWQQWLDPIVELLVVGGVVWVDLEHGLLPWVAFLLGMVIGLPLGAIRGRFMFVRSLGEGHKHKIVLERNPAEIGVLLGLIVIKLVARAVSSSPTSAINLISVGLLGIGIASSLGRVAYITIRHYHIQIAPGNSSPKS